jgi:anti-sigma regulatory factor (Ser/Thr protein kinase)
VATGTTVVALGHGNLAFVIGDVAGHGVRAAAVMGQLRNALRVFASEGYGPTAMVERLNRFVFENGPHDMATLSYAVLDPATGECAVVAAGHPPALLLHGADGRGDDAGGPESGAVDWLHGVGGPPVGAALRSRYRATQAKLAPGDTILLYTDGLIERRRESLDVGLERLRTATASAPAGADLDTLCDHVTAAMLPEGGSEDDVAVLAVRYLGNAPSAFRWRRPARASELSVMRRVMTSWLESAGVDRDDVALIAVAVSEAVTNSIEHAYGRHEGWVEIEARQEEGAVELVVRDGGRWRPKALGSGGRGLGLIGRLMDEFELRRAEQGTEVWMRKATRGPNGE